MATLSSLLRRIWAAFLISVYVSICSILGFIAERLNRSIVDEVSGSYTSGNPPQKDDQVASKNSTSFLSSGLDEKMISESEKLKRNHGRTEDSVVLQSELIDKQSMCQFIPVKDGVGFVEETKAVVFSVEEMFIGLDEHLNSTYQELESNKQEFGDELEIFNQEKVCKSADVEAGEDEEEHDFSYEIDLLPRIQFPVQEAEDEASVFSEFKFLISPQALPVLEEDDSKTEERKTEDLDDEFIEMDPKANKERSCAEDLEDSDEDDALLEHQNLVQQMKMELKECRSRGLPTISEDCETPRMEEELGLLKIDHKFEYKDLMGEISKFYRSYAEKMRKLDILNFQTLQAISFLQLKDSEVFTSVKKKSPLNFPRIWPCKQRRIHADPALKSIVELNRKLELVYIGQLCLSWEILGWMYMKAKELLQYDSQGRHSYNRVAEEFQQLQVLMQRFMEDERFRGPRVQNYAKNRCLIRSLLQVPMIRDDSIKDKKERDTEKDAVPLDSLLRMVGESMLVFREFLRADKCWKDVASKGTKIDLQEHADPSLLVDVIKTLQKKERRLKETTRSKNCIARKLQQGEEDDDKILRCQVEVRLIARVVGLSRLSSEQLRWCRDKLEGINFARRKLHVDPSFLLFPS